MTKIWCICCQDVATGEKWSFGQDRLQEGLDFLHTADVLAFHNGIGYDFRALKKVLGWLPKPTQKVRDTLVWARLCFSDCENDDLRSGDPKIQALSGSHSIAAWGTRLGVPKIHEDIVFHEYSPEILERCQQDVVVGVALYKHLRAQHTSEEALELEQHFALISEKMSERGFCFDVEGAEKLCTEIETKQQEIVRSIQLRIPGRIEEMKTPAYWLMQWPDGTEEQFPTKGDAELARKHRKVKPKECLLTRGPNKTKIHEFNPGSRKQVRDYLHKTYGFLSPKLTDKGQELLKEGGRYDELAKDYGQMSEDILRLQEWEEAKEIADYLMLDKRISQIKNGDNGWLKMVREDGKIHHSMIPCGTPTSRCRHFAPNLGQIPHVITGKNEAGEKVIKWGYEGRYGADCRNLFRASPGYVLVGIDLSGIEARMLAHYLYPYDRGGFADKVLTGDIHQSNADAFKRTVGYSIQRDDVKTPFYAFCYACGREKQGVTIVEFCPEAKQEYRHVVESLGRDRSWQKCQQIAAAVTWGTDTPRDGNDRKYRWLVRRVKEADNLQEISSLGYSVVGGRAYRAFVEGITGLDSLLANVQKQAERGYLAPLDGRRMPVRKAHAALNTLLQGSAAIIMKRWVVETMREARRRKLEAHILAIVHDEKQTETLPSQADEYAQISLDNIRKAGERYRLSIPLSGEAKHGASWAMTH